MSKQKKDLPKGFIKHMLGHGELYTDLIEIELVQIREVFTYQYFSWAMGDFWVNNY